VLRIILAGRDDWFDSDMSEKKNFPVVVTSVIEKLSSVERLYEETVFLVLERVKFGFVSFFPDILVPGKMSLGRAMTHRPAATGPFVRQSREILRRLQMEPFSRSREPTSGLWGWNGAVRSEQTGPHRPNIL